MTELTTGAADHPPADQTMGIDEILALDDPSRDDIARAKAATHEARRVAWRPSRAHQPPVAEPIVDLDRDLIILEDVEVRSLDRTDVGDLVDARTLAPAAQRPLDASGDGPVVLEEPVVGRSTRHLERSSVALVGNTAATGALGALFWLIAARLFPPEEVGAAVAAASLLIVLAFGAQLNLVTALSRYLPGAGAQQRSMVLFAYRVGALSAVVVGALVALVAFAREGVIVDGLSPALLAALVVSLPVWVLFTLQDGVLVAVRRSEWVPAENAVASVAKLVLLPLCVGVGGGAGVLLAWTIPAVPLVIGVSAILMRRFLHPGTERFTDRRQFVGYALVDLPGTMMYLISLRLVPLLVVVQLGAVEGAYIGVPWTIVTVAALVLPSISRSLLSELAHGDVDQGALLGRAVRLVFVVLAPCCLVGALAAGPLLAIAGGSYQVEGRLVLAWGLLGLIPAALVECGLATLRFQDRVKLGTTIQSVRAVALMAAVAALVAGGHRELIGAAFFAVGVVTAIGVVVVLARPAVGTLVRFVPLIAGVGFGVAAIASTEATAIGPAGLIDAVSPLFYPAVALVLVGFFVNVDAGRRSLAVAGMHLTALIVLLHGLPAFVEPNPRFPVAWLHAGFVEQLAGNGTLLPTLDARFSWAGFFAGGALASNAGGATIPTWVFGAAPIVVNLVACWAIWAVSRPFRLTQQQRLCALPVFVLGNWVGQDYFAPQAAAFVLYLIVIAVVFTLFGAVAPSSSRAGRWLRPGPVEVVEVEPRTRSLAYLAVLAMIAALIVSHQLTPFFLAAALVLMALTGSVRVRALGLATAVGAFAWLAFAAEVYWAGHWEKLIGSTGQVDQLLARNLADRATSTDLVRSLVVNSRIALAALVWAAAVTALVLAWRRRRMPVGLACLFIAPFPVLALQAYGGEMLLRAHLFALPAAAILIGTLLAPSRAGRTFTLRRQLLVAGALSLLVPVFLTARFGNERFEQVTDDDLQVAEAIYTDAPAGSVVYVLNRQAIVYAERVDEIRFATLTHNDDPAQIISEVLSRGQGRPTYLWVSESQQVYADQVFGRPDGWAADLRDRLRGADGLTVVAESGDAVLLLVDDTKGTS